MTDADSEKWIVCKNEWTNIQRLTFAGRYPILFKRNQLFKASVHNIKRYFWNVKDFFRHVDAVKMIFCAENDRLIAVFISLKTIENRLTIVQRCICRTDNFYYKRDFSNRQVLMPNLKYLSIILIYAASIKLYLFIILLIFFSD